MSNSVKYTVNREAFIEMSKSDEMKQVLKDTAENMADAANASAGEVDAYKARDKVLSFTVAGIAETNGVKGARIEAKHGYLAEQNH